MFAAILSKTARKNMIWSDKLRSMYMDSLKMLSVYEGYKIPDDFDLEIIFHDPMPQNEAEQIQVLTSKLADGLVALSTAMDEIGIENPQEEIAKILEERKTFDSSLIEDRVNNNKGNTDGNQ